jgi:ComF family protein
MVYPSTCLLCGAPGEKGIDLCTHCRNDLPRNLNPCRQCALPLPAEAPANALCGECSKKPPPFERSEAPFLYQHPVAELISGLKFHQKLAHSRLLAQLLLNHIEQDLDELPQLLIPVPLHRSRMQERGYNQALELARPLSRGLDIPLDFSSCLRIRPTPPQSSLHKKERHRNVRGAFEIRGEIAARHVALVDDVATTGSTVKELARMLRRHGIKRVDVWVLARTP